VPPLYLGPCPRPSLSLAFVRTMFCSCESMLTPLWVAFVPPSSVASPSHAPRFWRSMPGVRSKPRTLLQVWSALSVPCALPT
jgi:hypothetical protein